MMIVKISRTLNRQPMSRNTFEHFMSENAVGIKVNDCLKKRILFVYTNDPTLFTEGTE